MQVQVASSGRVLLPRPLSTPPPLPSTLQTTPSTLFSSYERWGAMADADTYPTWPKSGKLPRTPEKFLSKNHASSVLGGGEKAATTTTLASFTAAVPGLSEVCLIPSFFLQAVPNARFNTSGLGLLPLGLPLRRDAAQKELHRNMRGCPCTVTPCAWLTERPCHCHLPTVFRSL